MPNVCDKRVRIRKWFVAQSLGAWNECIIARCCAQLYFGREPGPLAGTSDCRLSLDIAVCCVSICAVALMKEL